MDYDNFSEQVYQLAREIPNGRVTSYGAIAESLGRKGTSRAVGRAMQLSKDVRPPVPAHRVVNSKGEITAPLQHGGKQMIHLLEEEGMVMKGNKILWFKKVFWHPKRDLQ